MMPEYDSRSIIEAFIDNCDDAETAAQVIEEYSRILDCPVDPLREVMLMNLAEKLQ